MAQQIKWGVLGAASIAIQRMMPAMREAPSATLHALASRDEGKARAVAAKFEAPRAYGDYDSLLADPEIDAVYVPLPNQLHFEWSIRALAAGKHVLCEKPLCLTSREVERLCIARDRAGKHIEEGFGYRNHAQWAKLLELIAGDAIGPVRAAHAVLAKQFLDPADVRNNQAAGGGALYDLGSYAINALNLVCGRPPLRASALAEHDPRFGIDRLTSALLDYGAAHATLTVASQAGPAAWATHQQLTVLGTRGWLRLNFPFAQARPVACRIELGDEQSVGAVPTTVHEFPPANQYALQIERFSRRAIGANVPAWPIEDALATLRTIEAVFASARSGAWRDVQ
ncbi:MAG TPA: Gfo/Idh/MocA family oxidoreductase [Steroidobacteraceae bacterium]|jgi:predicted dehydrogenase|nr:Gfo/Idh/MocA family oxidoreductase [Steroidobacteraceae bacterium]